MFETLLEMPLAVRLFIVFVVVVGLISLAAYVIYRAVRSASLSGIRRCRCRYTVTATVRPLSLKFCFGFTKSCLVCHPHSLVSTYYWKAKLQESSRQLRYFSHGLGARLYGAWPH